MGIGSVFKKWVAPIVVSACRLFSSAGSALFTLMNVFKFFNQEASIVLRPLSYLAIGINIYAMLATRIASIFRQFRGETAPHLPQENQPATTTPTAPQKKQCCACHCELGIKGSLVYSIFVASGILSSLFSSLNNYLGAITLMEFIGKEGFKSDVHDEEWKEITIQSIAILCAISNLISYHSFNVRKIKENARNLAQKIQANKNCTCDANIAKTISISLFSLVSSIFISYFSTNKAVRKIPHILIPEKIIIALSATAGGSSLGAALIADIPSLYDALSKNQQEEKRYQPTDTPRIESPLRKTTYTIGSIDAGNTLGCSTFISITNTMGDLFQINAHGYIMIPAAMCAISKTILGSTFFVRKGYLDTLQY